MDDDFDEDEPWLTDDQIKFSYGQKSTPKVAPPKEKDDPPTDTKNDESSSVKEESKQHNFETEEDEVDNNRLRVNAKSFQQSERQADTHQEEPQPDVAHQDPTDLQPEEPETIQVSTLDQQHISGYQNQQ